MKLSHSKLNCILGNPMEYFLIYREGISPKVEKPALAIGSAVHWGIEHNTDDLTEYYGQNFRTRDNYTSEQLLAEAMVGAYLKNKEEIFHEILKDKNSTESLQLIEETHEIYLNGQLKSFNQKTSNEFVGIIDLLLLTNKGFIIIDYKTSTFKPDWNNYLDQIYRYIFLLRESFPDIPVYKIGIVNIRKTSIRQKRGENWQSFLKRLQTEYEINDDELINVHMYNPEDLDNSLIDNYIENLSRMSDLARTIDDNNLFYINFSAANGQYGKSPYWDIYYHTPGAYVLYNIKDEIYDKDSKKILKVRDCKELDMLTIDHSNVLNKYEMFKAQAIAFYSINNDIDKDKFFDCLKKQFLTDDDLLETYWLTLLNDISNNSNVI